jgi:pimeloyl-ACP methyl ester carboxylesterase
MNRKVFLFAVILTFIGAAGFCGDTPDRMEAFNTEHSYYWLTGFPFEAYKPETAGLQPRIRDEAAFIKANEAKRDAAVKGQLDEDGNQIIPKYVLVGHSQGGLRALALGGYLKANDPALYDKLDGIITVSGIDRGLKALEGGVGTLVRKLQEDINIVYGGVRAAAGVFALPNIFTLFPGAPDFSLGTRLILKLIPEDFQFYYVALGMQDRADEIQEIKDMTPGSDFIKTYAANVAKKSQVVKEKIGTELVARVGYQTVGFITIPYIYFVTEDVYRTYTRTWEEDSSLKVGEEMPVGYMVGTNNNVFAPLDSKEAAGRNVINVSRGVFAAAEAAHILKSAAIIGLLSGSPQYIQDAHRARDFCGNIDGELHDILGSSANDGLVARESQSYPTAAHGNQLGFRTFEYSHEAMGDESAVRALVAQWAGMAKYYRR